MTGPLLSPAAAQALTGPQQARAASTLSFLATCARRAGVPHTPGWQLHHQSGATQPWRIVDTHAPAGPDGTGNVAVTLHAQTPAALIDELHIRGVTLRGVHEIRQHGWSTDLTAASRRPPS